MKRLLLGLEENPKFNRVVENENNHQIKTKAKAKQKKRRVGFYFELPIRTW